MLYVTMTARISSSSFRTVNPDCTPYVGHHILLQEPPDVRGEVLGGQSCWNLPLPKALATVRESLKTDGLVLALLRLRILALDQCRSARKSSWTGKETLLFLCFTSKTTKGNSQAGVSFPWSTCSLWTARSLRTRA